MQTKLIEIQCTIVYNQYSLLFRLFLEDFHPLILYCGKYMGHSEPRILGLTNLLLLGSNAMVLKNCSTSPSFITLAPVSTYLWKKALPGHWPDSCPNRRGFTPGHAMLWLHVHRQSHSIALICTWATSNLNFSNRGIAM